MHLASDGSWALIAGLLSGSWDALMIEGGLLTL